MIALRKSCRKCGASQRHTHVSYIAGVYYVYCGICRAETSIYATRDEAVKAWNSGKTKNTKV